MHSANAVNLTVRLAHVDLPPIAALRPVMCRHGVGGNVLIASLGVSVLHFGPPDRASCVGQFIDFAAGLPLRVTQTSQPQSSPMDQRNLFMGL